MAPEPARRIGLTWFLRFAGWATALALPCWLLAPFFRAGLLLAVNRVLASMFASSVQLQELEMDTPFDLGLFAALCLASQRTSARTRRLAMIVGLPTMLLLEVVIVVIGVSIMTFGEAGQRLGSYFTHTVQWVDAPLVWLVLLGAREIPLGRVEQAHPGSRERKPRAQPPRSTRARV